MAGIKDICKKTGLSVATVSRVFNDSPLVSQKTREKVLNAAEELNYRHNGIAAALRSGKSKTIGVIVPEINNYFFSNVINGIEEKLVQHGYNAIITQSHESPQTELTAINSLMKLKIDGIIISCSKETKDFAIFKSIEKEGVPVVFFDRKPNLNKANFVLLDDFQGGQIATQHLIDKGCRNLLHIAGKNNVSIFNERKRGFLDVVGRNTDIINGHTHIELSFNLEIDIPTIQNVLKTHPNIDGVFCHGDKYAIHIINIFRLLGYQIGDSIKIVGFGNNDYTEYTHPKISSIDQRGNEMGTSVAEILLENLEQETLLHTQRILKPILIERDSTSMI